MAMCFTCNGTGKMKCTICGGKGYTSRLTYGMEAEMSPCYPTMRCSSCNGTGKVGRDPDRHSRPDVKPPPPKPPSTNLAGRWQADDGSIYDVSGKGPRYKLTIRSPIGEATGTIDLDGLYGTLDMTLPMLGSVECEVEVAEDFNTMTIVTMGVPARFRRA